MVRSTGVIIRGIKRKGLWSRYSANAMQKQETQVSLDLQANGQWKQAQEILTNAISEHAARDLSTYETNGWRKDWVECCRQLAEWDVLKLYCASADEPNVLMECAWKSPDWSLVKSLFKTPSVVAKVEDALLPDINTSMLRIYTEIKIGTWMKLTCITMKPCKLF